MRIAIVGLNIDFSHKIEGIVTYFTNTNKRKKNVRIIQDFYDYNWYFDLVIFTDQPNPCPELPDDFEP